MLKINNLIDRIDFRQLRNFNDINEKWMFIKIEIIKVIDKVAPIRKIVIKNNNQFPWYDDDLIRLKNEKNLVDRNYF